MIDPLDGTTNFIHGMPFFAVSIALLYDKEPLVGVVFEINQDEMFSAWKNGGTFLNNERIQTSDAKTVSAHYLEQAFLTTIITSSMNILPCSSI